MKVLAIGDVVGSIGCKFLRTQLPTLKKEKNIDLVIANGENSADGSTEKRSTVLEKECLIATAVRCWHVVEPRAESACPTKR